MSYIVKPSATADQLEKLIGCRCYPLGKTH